MYRSAQPLDTVPERHSSFLLAQDARREQLIARPDRRLVMAPRLPLVSPETEVP
jgi:hypothetical protein